jgi:hypothetical protein
MMENTLGAILIILVALLVAVLYVGYVLVNIYETLERIAPPSGEEQ